MSDTREGINANHCCQYDIGKLMAHAYKFKLIYKFIAYLINANSVTMLLLLLQLGVLVG